MAARKKPAARYHHGDLRAALVTTAWGVVDRQGVEALSLRSVAEALGVSHAAPAHHFPDKAALVDAVRAEGWARFTHALEAAEPEGLRVLARAYLRFAQAHPRQLGLMFQSGVTPSAEVSELGGRAWQALVRSVAKTIGPARAADPKELNAMAAAAWSSVHGFAGLTTFALPEGLAGGARGADALQDRVLDVVLKGLRSR